MCGLVGYYGHVGDPDSRSALLQAMSGTITHRGPDDSGHWQDDDVGLGHRRLAIVGVAEGQQPMLGSNDALVVSYNGEIFNHVELRQDLSARGHQFRGGSDTEVILALFAEYGPACVDHMNGDFAFALWDRRSKQLFLARDRMGVRPLFYSWVRGRLYFASEIKALLRVPGLVAEPDPFALDDIFTHWSPLPPRTAFKDILELPPGHTMTVDANGSRINCYWQLDFPDLAEAEAPADADATAEEVLALLEDSVRIRLRADVPVSSYLSGGLDSSIITALGARLSPDQLRSFSVAFTSPEHDESVWQNRVAQALGTRHAAIQCSGDDIGAVFPQVIAHAERPVLRTAPAPLFMLSRLVADQGLKVVLTGEGADEVFGGYDLFKEAKVRRFAARQPGSRMRPLLFKRLYPYLAGLQGQSPEYLAAFFGADPQGLNDPLHSHRPRMRGTSAAKLVYSAELKAALAGYDATEALLGQLPERFARWHPLHQAQYLESSFLLPGYILSAQGDRMAMAHGVEARFPFLDHRLVERAARIPPRLKLKGLVEKFILRHAARELLPADITNRPKQPYRAPDSACFVGAGQPDYVAAMLSATAVAEAGLFNPATVQGLLNKAQNSGLQSFRDNTAFVGVLSSQIWHQTFIGNAALRAVDAA